MDHGKQDRRCVVCGAALNGKRRHAIVCGGACRADRSRAMRILAGQTVDGAASLADLLARRRKRTERGEGRSRAA